jgi:hypothetical protein
LLLALFLASACAGSREPVGATIAITRVSVIDLANGTIRSPVTVLIQDGRIVAVDSSVPVPARARVLDGSGKYLIPGLWDMHTHQSELGAAALPLYVKYGVTGIRDAGGSRDSIARWRREILAGRLIGPRIVASGPVLESGPWLERLPKIDRRVESAGVPRLSFERAIERLPVVDAISARNAVDSALALGAQFVKARTYVDSATFFTIARRAKERGVDFVGHPPPDHVSWVDAARAGMTGIEHMGGAYQAQFGSLTPEERRKAFQALAALPVYLDPNVVGDAVRAMPDSAAIAFVGDTAGHDHPAMAEAPPHLVELFRRDLAIRLLESKIEPTDWRSGYRKEVALLHEAYASGVAIVAGTDVESLLTFPGSSLHQELRLLVRDVGMTPLDALRSATIVPARALHLEQTSGAIRPGMAADLVLLAANPLERIDRIDEIVAVIAQGRLVTPTAGGAR